MVRYIDLIFFINDFLGKISDASKNMLLGKVYYFQN